MKLTKIGLNVSNTPFYEIVVAKSFPKKGMSKYFYLLYYVC
jgi:ribosomal protein S16